MLVASASNQSELWFWRHLWKLKLPTQIKIFIWKFVWNFFPIKSSLMRRRGCFDSLCSICLNHKETIKHLLGCQRSLEAWFLFKIIL